jgi:prolipoprotein diacylglyceryltransferase
VLYAIRFDFDPVISPFGLSVRLETLALAGVILLVLVAAGLMAGLARAHAERDDPKADEAGLRRDDLILIAFGAVPGAVAGGRLGYGLAHLDYYLSDPGALLDPGKGGLSLTAAVLLGTLTAMAVGRLVGAPLRAWLHLAALPLLLGLGLGKLAMALGGSGQGAYSDATWATAYAGSGPWGSLNPADAAIPSQVLEGCLVLLLLACLVLAPGFLRLRPELRPRPALRLAFPRERRLLTSYRRFLTALGLWAAVRFCVAFTWRDARVAGPFSVEQLELAALIVACAWALFQPWLAESRASRAKRFAARRVAERQVAALLAAVPEYSREERGSEVQVVPERARVEPAERPTPRRTHKPRGKPGHKRRGSGS